jgi:hypothetical protein
MEELNMNGCLDCIVSRVGSEGGLVEEGEAPHSKRCLKEPIALYSVRRRERLGLTLAPRSLVLKVTILRHALRIACASSDSPPPKSCSKAMRPRASSLPASKASSDAESTRRMMRDYSHSFASPIDHVEDARIILRVGDCTFELFRDTMNSTINGGSNGPNHIQSRSLRELVSPAWRARLTRQRGL